MKNLKKPFLKALEIIEKVHGENSFPSALVYHNLGALHYSASRFQKAIKYQQQALGIYQATLEPDHLELSKTMLGLAASYSAILDIEKAYFYAQKSLDIRKTRLAFGNFDLIDSYNMLAYIFRIQGKLDSAELFAKIALDQLFPGIDTQNDITLLADEENFRFYDALTVLTTLTGLAEAQLYQYHLEDARLTYITTISLIEQVQSRGQTLEDKLIFTEEFWINFYALQYAQRLLYAKTGDIYYLEEAFAYSEKSKAVLLRQNIQADKALSFADIPDKVLSEGTKLLEELNQAEQSLYQTRISKGSKPEQLKNAERDWIAKRRVYQNWIQQLEYDFPNYYRFKYDQKLVFPSDVMKSLPDRHTWVLEYYWVEGGFFLYGFNQDTIAVHIDSANFDIPEKMDQLFQIIHDPEVAENQGYSPEVFQKFTSLSHELYQRILSPILSRLPIQKDDKLIIIPDGPLGYLPFELLIQDLPEDHSVDYGSLSYVLKSYQVRYEYTASSFQNPAEQSFGRDYLGIAPSFGSAKSQSEGLARYGFSPLVHNQFEVEAVSKLLGGRALTGQMANEHNVKKSISKSNILHFATHTWINDTFPLYSGLILNREKQEAGSDGVLNAYEIYRMDLNAQLAVLSACQTGWGKWQRGEGVISIGRSFKYAGCPNIVMSLWQADDKSTSTIVTDFFTLLQEDMPKAEALRKAKLDFLERSPRHQFPHYWGTFVLVGDNTPLALSFWDNLYLNGPLILITVVIIVVVTIMLRRRSQ